MVFQVAKNTSDSTASNNRSKGTQEKDSKLITKPRSNRDSAECYTACGNQESQSICEADRPCAHLWDWLFTRLTPDPDRLGIWLILLVST